MVVSSAKFTILISWSPICIRLILLSALMKLASTSTAIIYNSMESKHPWRTRIRVKGSDRRPFILILDSILVHATLIMGMNLSPYPNELRQSRKDKTNSKDITERLLFSFFDTSIMSQIVERRCKFILFLIASDWFSPIIVSNVFCIRFLRISSINFIV